jgi:CubicO group peptidase (beta-lactamase class C family)
VKRRDFISLTGMGAVGASLPPLPWPEGGPHAGLLNAATDDDPRFEEIAELIEAKMAEYRVTGVAFGLMKDGAAALRGFGLTNVDNPQPVTPDTVFPIASITKTVVAVAMLRLVEQGRVALDAPVREYLPDFGVRDEEASRAVTVRHLLMHTPGWEGQLEAPDRGDETHANFVTSIRDLPQLARPGEVWSYNNAGFGVAGRILEVLTGRVIHEALRDLVFDPLGLTLAFTRTRTAMTYRFAAPHSEQEGRTVVLRPFTPPMSAAGSAAMSLSSLMAYARFHLGDGLGSSREPVLTPASLALMRTPQGTKRPTTDEMGVGWHLRRLNGVLTAVHCGTLIGHCLHLQLVPERDLAFAFLTNHMQGWRLISDVERAILELYEGLALAPNQRTGGDRGGFEDMTAHATPLSPQPAHGQYLGRYERPPLEDRITVTTERGRLMALGSIFGFPFSLRLVFWAPDMAYAEPDQPLGEDVIYPYRGVPVEFIRDGSGEVRWCRLSGRIGRKG